MSKYYTIGQLAQLAGISTKTLRIYEHKGLLLPERNEENGYRMYGEEAVAILEKIQLMKYLDFSLDQIADFLQLYENGHLITDMVWFHEIMETQIRSKVQSKEERQSMYQKGYADFHRLNYILRNEFGLVYHLEEDRNLELEGLHPELYDEVVQGLYQDFFDDPEAETDDLEVYTYDISLECIRLCIKECVNAITAFRKGEELIHPEKYYVPTHWISG